ncbi:MAG: TrmH family RNA methyltransferase [Bacteroidia bacterium]|nr:TrmH family RNA methyltransferase [Bacteroidia bacterium]MCX7651618.1 TrmH family RNA methyltransferase [Bacteroidia bacterium]MDW8417297.1 TrmH family RNA methyltransferase [Bacteroidia bacterium]
MSQENRLRKLTPEELGRLSVEDYRAAPKFPMRLLLDNLRSRYNVGSLLRSADAFRVEKVYLAGFTPAPPHPEIHRSALGAEESVEWEKVYESKSIIEALKGSGWTVISLEHTNRSVKIWQFRWPPAPWLIILGNELTGVSDTLLHLSDEVVEIPQFGTKHSLNVAIAGGIVLYEAAKHLMAEGFSHNG